MVGHVPRASDEAAIYSPLAARGRGRTDRGGGAPECTRVRF